MHCELIDRMGDDIRVANAARVSFNKETDWEPTDIEWDPSHTYSVEYGKKLSLQDQKLIIYLAKHNHWSPFSHVMITMRETVPIFVARQRFKHMVGFTYNEVSRRYVDDDPEFFIPDEWRKAAENKKQGSGENVDKELNDLCDFWSLQVNEFALRHYGNMISEGVAPEQARMVLPQSMYTSYYTTGSLAAWARAYRLRSDPGAQLEIQNLATMWNNIISDIPELKYSWNALIN